MSTPSNNYLFIIIWSEWITQSSHRFQKYPGKYPFIGTLFCNKYDYRHHDSAMTTGSLALWLYDWYCVIDTIPGGEAHSNVNLIMPVCVFTLNEAVTLAVALAATRWPLLPRSFSAAPATPKPCFLVNVRNIDNRLLRALQPPTNIPPTNGNGRQGCVTVCA